MTQMAMEDNKRILYVTTRLFWPPDSGRKVTLYHYCEGMHEQYGYEVHVFSFLEDDQFAEMVTNKPDFISSVAVADRVSALEKAKNVIKAVFDSEMPFQCCLFQSKSNRVGLRCLVESLQPDVVIFDMVRLAPYADSLKGLGCAIIMDFDDLLSKRYIRQLGRSGNNVLGKYGAGMPGLINHLINGPMKNAVLKLEAGRIARAEEKYGKEADACLLVSPLEAKELGSRIGEKRCFSATVGANLLGPFDRDAEKKYEFGFVGNMHTSANQDSLRYITEEIMPKIPNAQLRVIGVCPDEVRREYENNASVSFTGRIDSVAFHLNQCSALLAPFAYGTGVKTKVLEAMGMGIPVVTNSIGLEGLAAERSKDILCADTADELASEACRLLEDETLRHQIATAGREYVEHCHTWESSIADLVECLNFAIAERKSRQFV